MSFSLSKKAMILIVSIAVVISILAVAVYNNGITDLIRREYEERSKEIARLVALETDSGQLLRLRDAVLEIYNSAENRVLSDQWGSPEFNDYVALYGSLYDMDEYKLLLTHLREMQGVLNVDCLYLIWIDAENARYVYLVDAALEDPCPIGCIDPLFSDDPALLTHPENGIVPTISNTPEYGWLLATGMPVFDGDGSIVGFATVDISMNEIMSQRRDALVFAVIIFLLMAVLVCILAIVGVNRTIVRPINMLSKAAEQYSRNRKVFSELKIPGRDEIGMLADSMTRMESEINGYISNLEKTTSDLIEARELASEMDKIANIDALTKVRNKRAFDLEAERLNGSSAPYGLIMIDMNGLKYLNDNFGHEKGDAGLKEVCRVICQAFRHSPVFRVGGDEFIVVLEGSDFEERGRLAALVQDEFRAKNSDMSLEPWERVSAALGCAVCDRASSETCGSVLKRADKVMYENKCAWKNSRN